jgi:hypothetical protein
MANTIELRKPVNANVGRKKISLKKSASYLECNLATIVALAECAGVPVEALLNEALNDFIEFTGRYLATERDISRKEWEKRMSPEVKERCAAALRALNPGDYVDQALMDRVLRDLDPDNHD